MFGVVVFVVHSWSVGGFLYHLPYFALRYPAFEIAGIFSYYMVFALLESVLFAGILVALAALLPARWLRDEFAFEGTLITVGASVMGVILQSSPAYDPFTFDLATDPTLFARLGAVAFFVLGVFLMAFRYTRVQRWTSFVAEQVSVMLFLYIPLDVLGLVVTTLRLV